MNGKFVGKEISVFTLFLMKVIWPVIYLAEKPNVFLVLFKKKFFAEWLIRRWRWSNENIYCQSY